MLSATALGCFVMAVDALSGHGEVGGPAPLFVVSAVAGAAFLAWQARAPRPLVPLDIFAARRFSAAAGTSFLAFTAQGLVFITLPFLFQSIQGYSPFMSAVLFTPWPVVIIGIGPRAGRLSDRLNPALLSTVGLVVFSLGLVALALLGPSASIPDILWRTALCGLGWGCFQPPNNHELLGSVARERSGTASGVLASARTFGQSVGAALVAIVLAQWTTDLHPTAGNAIVPVRLTLWIGCGIAVAAVVVSALRIASAGAAARARRAA